MALIVLDASVLVKVLLPERGREANVGNALALWRRVGSGALSLRQPPHWLAEVAAVLARLSPATALDDVRDLMAMQIPLLASVSVYQTACRLALELDHHLFDTLYHAVALEAEALLVTADARYFDKAQARGRIVRLEDYDAGT